MKHTDNVWYGGDYNPDQWPKDIWDIDFELFDKAHVNMLTLPVFSWAKLQRPDGSYDFSWLIEIIERAAEQNIGICLATSTAVQPAWLSKRYPEILPVDAHGNKRRFGGRVNFCPNSDVFKEYARALVTHMADVVKNFDNIVMWHIGNEYDNYCYCDNCKVKFQQWAKAKYKTVDALNKAWYLQFWGHQIYEFDEIEIPDYRSELWDMGGLERTNFQAILLDYKRFMNESILSCYLNELEVIREKTPEIPVTTNFMAMFKPLNYFEWAKHLDVISWDHYPGLGDPMSKSAMLHDMMRSLKKDRGFWLMEQSPSQQNWAPYNTLKRPGDIRLQSYQTVARGADAVLYFQMRRSLGNCEKFHGALIDHHGNERTRVFKECQNIGEELIKITDIIGSTIKAKAAIVFDWENWWAIDMSSGPSIDLRYTDVIEQFHKGIYNTGEIVDFVNSQDDLSDYKVIYAPMLYMVKKEMAEKLEAYVKNGGTLVLTTFTGIADENDHVTTSGYPGFFREMAGIWVEEIDGVLPDMKNEMVGYNNQTYTCGVLCDVIHLEGATAMANYGKDFYKDTPVLTKNNYGEGQVYYIGTIPEQQFINDFAESFLGVNDLPEGVEKTVRTNDGQQYEFYLNYTETEKLLILEGSYINLLTGNKCLDHIILKQKDAVVLKKL